ncbi:transposase [Labrenzia sp. EL_126]|nr:transposase [Labrenzia sp. EL_126]
MPDDHLLRSIDRFIDLSDVREHLKPFYSHTGHPPVDPELMIRMLIIGYTHGIRSERRLCAEVHLNLAYRWFCRLDLTDAVPDHSTFSKNRHGRFRDSNLFRKVFETVVTRCIAEDVVCGERFATDASLVEADVNKQNSTAKEDWDLDKINPETAARSVREYLFALDDEAFGAATDVIPKFTSHADPSSQWTAAHPWSGLFSLFKQLFHRHRPCDHRRCGGKPLGSHRRDPCHDLHDRSREGALRPVAATAHRRHGLWHRRILELAC